MRTIFATPSHPASPTWSSLLAGTLAAALAAVVAAAEPGRGVTPTPQLVLEPVATGLSRPLLVTHAGDGSGRLFIAEQQGAIRVVRDGVLLPTPFLDLDPISACCGEQGLLGLAFHPDYEANGTFFVSYSDNAGDSMVARYQVSAADPDVADPTSATVVMTQDQPYSNHNGGQIAFGPDGYLYVALGDGGSAGDPLDSGQTLSTRLGKLLRVDVDGDDFPTDPDRNYAIPPTNPFVGDPSALDEIWAWGLRNPWRFSFDRSTGDLFIADVGQSQWEEVNFQPAASPGGENYGWRRMEGTHCYNPSVSCNDGTLTLPILEYSHASGCSITGGYRYRGADFPNLRGHYLYADYCSGQVWGAIPDGVGWSATPLLATGFAVSTFGEDEGGELYVADHAAGGAGRVLRIVDTSPVEILFADDFETGTPAGWSFATP